MTKNKILYIGFGFNGEPGLDSLIKQGSFDIVGVVVPPADAKHHRKLYPNGLPVETLAEKNSLPIYKTDDNKEIQKIIEEKQPTSVIMCYYTKIIPAKMLEGGPTYFNIHHGCVLPRLRGSSNTEWAIRNGINKITISLFQVVPGLDEGDLYWEPEITITDEETVVDLRRKMNDCLRENLGKVYAHILNPEETPELNEQVFKRTQKDEGATYVCSIRPEDNVIEWSKPAKEIYNLIRSGCDEEVAPVITFYQGNPIRIWKAKLQKSTKVWEGHIPGKPVARTKEGVEILTGDKDYTLLLQEIEKDGEKKPAKEIITSIRDTLGLSQLELWQMVQKLQ
jgi:methionyl-tRNA formyltransferase